MFCTKCGNLIQQDNSFCGNCGEKVTVAEPIQTINETAAAAQPEPVLFGANTIDKKPKSNKKWYIALITGFLLISIGCAVYFFGYPYYQYKQAQSLLDNKEYEEAIEAFTKLDGFSDSEELIMESEYRHAKQLMDDEEYLKASERFSKMESYKDSKELSREAKYQIAKQYVDEKDYSKATVLLNQLKDYKDSEELLEEMVYYPLQGTWEADNGYGFRKIIISGEEVTNVFFPDTDTESKYTDDLLMTGNTFEDKVGTIYYVKDGKLYVQDYGADVAAYRKVKGS